MRAAESARSRMRAASARTRWEASDWERSSRAREAPLMLTAIILSARFVVRRFPAPRRADYLASGGVALLLLVLVEFSVVLGIRGLSLGEYFAERDPVAGSVYVIMLAVFAAMPWLLGGRRHGK